jgi:hypothetical protein
MDILYRNIVDIFFLVTSDSDFTKLAYRVKESGKTIIGMGESKTPEALAQACNEFKVLDVLYKAVSGKKKEAEVVTAASESDAAEVLPVEPKIIEIPTESAIVDKVLSSLDDEWENLANVGDVIRKSIPGFDVRNYKYNSFSSFVKAHRDVFEVSEELGPDHIHKIVNIKKKPQPVQEPSKKKATQETGQKSKSKQGTQYNRNRSRGQKKSKKQ